MRKLKNKVLYYIKLLSIIIISAMVLFVGCIIAAYNTEMFGFDGENQIIYKNNEEIFVLGIEIQYEDIEKAKEKTIKFIKDGIVEFNNI